MNEFKTDVQGTKDIYTIEYRTNNRANYEKAQELIRKFVDNKPKTNFDRITESVEALAEIMDNYRWCPYFSNSTCDSEIECKECIKEWLQKECDNE